MPFPFVYTIDLTYSPLVGRRNMRCVPCTLSTAFFAIFIHIHFSVFVQCHIQSLMSSLLLLPWIHPTRWRMSPQRHIILTYTALFTISLFSLSGSKKFAASVALPFPSSLLDAKLICDHQLLILILRITLVRG